MDVISLSSSAPDLQAGAWLRAGRADLPADGVPQWLVVTGTGCTDRPGGYWTIGDLFRDQNQKKQDKSQG
jgi:hypothetical protein